MLFYMLKNGKDVLSIVITFVFGFIGGFYFFLTGYAPYVEQVKETILVEDASVVESLIITAKEYGGCERQSACASFQLEYDGTFRYLAQSITTGATPVTGTLPRALLNNIRSATAPSILRQAATPVQFDNCAQYSDGIDYHYEVVRNGELYILDTCTTNLTSYPKLLETLGTIWRYVEN